MDEHGLRVQKWFISMILEISMPQKMEILMPQKMEMEKPPKLEKIYAALSGQDVK